MPSAKRRIQSGKREIKYAYPVTDRVIWSGLIAQWSAKSASKALSHSIDFREHTKETRMKERSKEIRPLQSGTSTWGNLGDQDPPRWSKGGWGAGVAHVLQSMFAGTYAEDDERWEEEEFNEAVTVTESWRDCQTAWSEDGKENPTRHLAKPKVWNELESLHGAMPRRGDRKRRTVKYTPENRNHSQAPTRKLCDKKAPPDPLKRMPRSLLNDCKPKSKNSKSFQLEENQEAPKVSQKPAVAR